MDNSGRIGCDLFFKMVAVTGGPCGGKSTFLSQARAWLEDRGMRVLTLSEVATELISAGVTPWSQWKDPLAFQSHLLRYQLMREEQYRSMWTDMMPATQTVMLCDRGGRDGEAYVGKDNFLAACERCGIDAHRLYERYAGVVHLVTAAVGAESHYTLDNNPSRTESDLEEARGLDARTRSAWNGHPHFCLIDNSTDFEQKKFRALNSLARILSMPQPLEKERKFLVRSFNLDLIPEGSVAIPIEQDYLLGTDEIERRVRSRRVDGGMTYYYTEKKKTNQIGVREEVERVISFREYDALLRERDPKCGTVAKVRHCFEYAGKHFELDVYERPMSGLVILEIEVADMREPVSLPVGWDLVEVTGDDRYSNKAISSGSLA